MKNKSKIIKDTSGITLIALIVTIIVLIILATISINLVAGDGGIINQAQKAAEAQANAEQHTTTALDSYANVIAEKMENMSINGEENNDNIIIGTVPEILQKYILGVNKKGRIGTEIFNTTGGGVFKNDTATIANAENLLECTGIFQNTERKEVYIGFTYSSQSYVAVANTETYKTFGIVLQSEVYMIYDCETEGHTDIEDQNEYCDYCGIFVGHVDDGSGVCIYCNAPIEIEEISEHDCALDGHIDEDVNDYCDSCGEHLNHTDEDEDNICDECGSSI